MVKISYTFCITKCVDSERKIIVEIYIQMFCVIDKSFVHLQNKSISVLIKFLQTIEKQMIY